MPALHSKNILRAAYKYNMFQAGDKVLVAVSGGPDSVAMLYALYTLSDDLKIDLHVAHLNHGIRGDESDGDAEFVCELAAKCGLPVTKEKADIPSIKAELKTGEEEAARIVRYSFLRKTALMVGANKIAVGHNADDRAESVLFNIIRGTGIEGLGSIKPVRGNIVRPLINTYRSEIKLFINEIGISYRIDSTNSDINYSRNRIRHKLIPLIEDIYNPQIKSALNRIAEIASAQTDYMATAAYDTLCKISNDGIIDANAMVNLPCALQQQIIRSEIKRVRGDIKDITYEQIERIIDELSNGDNFKITLPSGELYAIRNNDEFFITRKIQNKKNNNFCVHLDVPGTTDINIAGLSLRSEIIPHPIPQKISLNEVIIDSSSIKGNLIARNAVNGDRIIPFGMHGDKKLHDIFIDKKVPVFDRSRSVVIADDEKILWVPGIVSSEKIRITDNTKTSIHICADNHDIKL